MAVLSDHQHQQRQQRSKKSKAGQKKQPQRGLGVAQLERLRIQEESKKAMLASSSAGGSCLTQVHHGGRLCLSPPHNLHLHHLAMSGSGAGTAGLRSNVPFLSSIGASSRYQQHLDQNISPSIHGQLDGFQAKIHSQASGGGGNGGDSSSCKSGISYDASAIHNLFGGRSSSPSPCSSFHKVDQAIGDESEESSRGASAVAVHPPFMFWGSCSSSFSEARNKNKNTGLLANQPGISSTNTTIDSSEMFDPSFRSRARRVHGDGRDWPGVYSSPAIPAIKELSSFQIPGNTIPALSSTSKSCWTGARDGAADLGSGYSGNGSSKIIGASSPRSLSAASSWARSEAGFSFEQQLKDSCSSSLKNNNNVGTTTNLEATSSTRSDFLALGLASASPESRAQLHKRPSGIELKSSPAAAADDESVKFAVAPQEASGETDDHWLLLNSLPRKSVKLGHSANPLGRLSSPCMLELSLNVPSLEESSLELKLAL